MTNQNNAEEPLYEAENEGKISLILAHISIYNIFSHLSDFRNPDHFFLGTDPHGPCVILAILGKLPGFIWLVIAIICQRSEGRCCRAGHTSCQRNNIIFERRLLLKQ